MTERLKLSFSDRQERDKKSKSLFEEIEAIKFQNLRKELHLGVGKV